MRIRAVRSAGAILALLAAACGGGSDDGDEGRTDVVDDGAAETVADADATGDDAEAVDAADDAGEDEAEAPGDVAGDEGSADVADVVEDGATDGDGGAPRTGCIEGTFAAYRGDLHAHTGDSDGEGSPSEAFAYARDVAGLDIMVVTDHLEQLYLGLGIYADCRDDADAAYAPGTYVTACGFEYGSGFDALFRSTGHNNVFFSPGLFPAIQRDFHDFYASLAGCAECVGQYNHPGDSSEEHWNHFEHFADVDERMMLFEMNSDPAWTMYFDALDAGWHVSPMYNQDNHSANWGTANDRRSGFWMAELTREELRRAMLERRSFSTTDRNASIRALAFDTCWMGSILGGAPAATIDVLAEDEDDGDGFTSVELYGPGGALRETIACDGTASCAVSFEVAADAPTYAVARALQADGGVLIAAPLWLSP